MDEYGCVKVFLPMMCIHTGALSADCAGVEFKPKLNSSLQQDEYKKLRMIYWWHEKNAFIYRMLRLSKLQWTQCRKCQHTVRFWLVSHILSNVYTDAAAVRRNQKSHSTITEGAVDVLEKWCHIQFTVDVTLHWKIDRLVLLTWHKDYPWKLGIKQHEWHARRQPVRTASKKKAITH